MGSMETALTELSQESFEASAPEQMAPGTQWTKIPTVVDLRAERAFALAVAIVPFLGFLGAIVWRRITPVDFALMVVMYSFTALGITVGFHRLFTHRSFDCPKWVRAGFAIAGSMAVQGPVIRWVADHRRHHAFSDKPGDPHSPQLWRDEGVAGLFRGLWYSHMGWFFAAEKTRIRKFVPDLLADATVKRIDARYFTWLLLSLALPFVLGGAITWSWRGALTAFLWAGLVRIFFVHHVTWSINSICHVMGKRPNQTTDLSTNNAWLAIPSFGESWHNNHHAIPSAATHGFGRYQLDLSGLLIGALERLGLAWKVVRPSAEQIAQRARVQHPSV
jgi:stearoyl-CoA desaturase (delta-9 desaturase)